MEYGAIDLHKHESQIRIVREDGALVDQRFATTRDRFTAVFSGRPQMRILLEASTESEWVAQHLETFGHEVIVADRILRRCTVSALAGPRRIGGMSRRWRRRVNVGILLSAERLN